MKKYFVIDLDNTLISENTFFLLAHELASHFPFWKRMKVILLLFLTQYGILDFLVTKKKKILLKEISGVDKKIIDMASKGVIKKIKNNNLIDKTSLELLHRKKREGFEIVILSKAPEPVVKEFSKMLGIKHFYGSRWVFDNGKFLKEEEIDKKRILRQMKQNSKKIIFLSDNLDDCFITSEIVDEFWGFVPPGESPSRWNRLKEKISKIVLSKKGRYTYHQALLPFFILLWRSKSITTKLEFFLYPVLFGAAFNLTPKRILLLTLFWICSLLVYETGYIINSCYSVKHELQPKYLLSPKSCRKMMLLVGIRLFLISLILFYLKYRQPYPVESFLFFLLILFITFIMHNSVNTTIRKVVTYPLLQMLKYTTSILPFISRNPLLIFSLIVSVWIFHGFYSSFEYFVKKSGRGISYEEFKEFKQATSMMFLLIFALITIVLESEIYRPFLRSFLLIGIYFSYTHFLVVLLNFSKKLGAKS